MDNYDVVVIGGAFSGASCATLLKRRLPDCRILIVERSERFDRKVGEATVEVSAFFLHQVLGLYDHLSRRHLPKHGLRFWLSDGPGRRLDEMTEIGGGQLPRLPSFQLDRRALDQYLLATAANEGCEVARPARVHEVEHGWPSSRVRLEHKGGERRVRARWVIDASGRHAFLARRLNLRQRVEEHPTAAAWARWRGVADLDGPELAAGLPRLPAARRLATNHFCGYGWWAWVIPLAGGETSIGVVYHKELAPLAGDGSLRQRYERFVRSRPGLGQLLAEATVAADDFMAYGHLPYKTSRYMDRGWALVGDAAAFNDPFYSPGLDHVAIASFATARLIEGDLAGRLDDAALDVAITTHNGNFLRSYDRWLAALYLGKYELMGDAELLASAFLVDTSLYYLGVVTPICKDPEVLVNPVFGLSLPQAKIAYRLTRAFKRRLVGLARHRRRVGTYGRRNVGWRLYCQAFDVGPTGSLKPLCQGLAIWLRLEAQRAWHLLCYGWRQAPEAVEAKRAASAES